MRQRLEEERRALAAFVTRFDSLGLASTPSITTGLKQPALLSKTRRHGFYSTGLGIVPEIETPARRSVSDQSSISSPMKTEFSLSTNEVPSLLKGSDSCDFMDLVGLGDLSFEGVQTSDKMDGTKSSPLGGELLLTTDKRKLCVSARSILQDKENFVPFK